MHALSLVGGFRMNMPWAMGFCAAMPVPVADCTLGELEALLTNEMFSEAVPLAFGLNVSTKGALWPAAIVIGNETPLTEKGADVVGGEEIVTLAPLALRVPF